MREWKNKIEEVEFNSTQLDEYEKTVKKRKRCEREIKTRTIWTEKIVNKYKSSEERKSELHEVAKHYERAFNAFLKLILFSVETRFNLIDSTAQ